MRIIFLAFLAMVMLSGCTTNIVKREIPESSVILLSIEDFESEIYKTYIGYTKFQNYQISVDSSFDLKEHFQKTIVRKFESNGYKVVVLEEEWRKKISGIYDSSFWVNSISISDKGKPRLNELREKYSAQVLIDIELRLKENVIGGG